MPPVVYNQSETIAALDAGATAGKLTPEAAELVRIWLTEPRYATYAPQVAEHIREGKWKELDDAFWTIIPFGTGGRRGKMYPFGSNTVNERTIGESAQGVADYIRQQLPGAASPGCAIAYDTRHRSREFAELCAGIMVAAGLAVYFLDGYRSTPELSFCVRYQKCACGIMVTASHNPPSDNAVKVYWSNGGQILPPHDIGIIERVMSCQEIKITPFAEAVAAGKVIFCQDEVDAAYLAAVKSQAIAGARELKIIYSPLHGVGASAVMPALESDGFRDVELFSLHAEPNGDFPNVPGHVANPENAAVFESIVERARKTGADLTLASDPDCDRIGIAAPVTVKPGSTWDTFTGNQIGSLLAEFVLEARKKAGNLSKDHYVVKTLVTTEMIRRIAEAYGVRTVGDLQVGFKWIGKAIDEHGPERFVLGAEESHGYLVGAHVRDKDAVVSAMLLAELAAKLKAAGQTLHEKLDSLFWQYGYHAEKTVSVTMPGSQGMKDMQSLMIRLRESPPEHLAGLRVVRIRDYQQGTVTAPGGQPNPLQGPQGDMVILDLEAEGNYVAVRPSGTEPKVKFYVFAYEPAEQLHKLEETKAQMAERLDAIQGDLAAFAKLK